MHPIASSGKHEIRHLNRYPVSFVLAALAAGCDPQPAERRAPSSEPLPSPAPSAEARARAPKAAAAASPAPAVLELQKLTITSNVKNREPADRLEAAEPGMRVWAHAKVRNRTGESRRVSLIFRKDGEERSTVDLKVEPSWSFRTWGYNTLRAGDQKGTLSIELRDDKGELLGEAKLPIEAKARKKR